MCGCLIYLRLAVRPRLRFRSVERLAVACTVFASLGFALAVWDCLAVSYCARGKRVQLSWIGPAGP